MQKKSHSFYEAVANISVGLLVSAALTYYALPLWGLEPEITEAVEITILYTVASLVRTYGLRRVFNWVAQ